VGGDFQFGDEAGSGDGALELEVVGSAGAPELGEVEVDGVSGDAGTDGDGPVDVGGADAGGVGGVPEGGDADVFAVPVPADLVVLE
jgi:hypothetical protein